MLQNPTSRRVLLVLIVGALLLPIVICVLMGVSILLGAMGDSLGGYVLGRVALGCGILWVICLICLLVAEALGALVESDEPK